MNKMNNLGAEGTVISHDIVALEEALKERVVHMVYVKKSGAMRDAHGTRATHLIPEGYRAQGCRKPSPLVLTYWDTDRGGWRCLLRNRLLGWIASPLTPLRKARGTVKGEGNCKGEGNFKGEGGENDR